MSVSAPPPPRANARLRPESVPTLVETPLNLTTSNQKRWVDLSFKVTENERDEFRVEAALRRMSHKELLQAAMALYREQFPVPVR